MNIITHIEAVKGIAVRYRPSDAYAMQNEQDIRAIMPDVYLFMGLPCKTSRNSGMSPMAVIILPMVNMISCHNITQFYGT